MEIQILFENTDLVAVYKPEGLTSIPGSEKGNNTLVELLSKQRGQKLFVVHRLDKDVSGVMLFAGNPAAHKSLNDQFANHSIRKTYVALVHGCIKNPTGLIDKPVHKFGSGRMGVDELRGKASSTEYVVSERFEKHTLLKAHPLTGRKHQIRVHFYSIGHPIAGDKLYGDKAAQLPYPRMMLHALSITFKLPSGLEMTVDAPVAESFTAVVKSLK
jgi:tRNA pseudouridine32 synthase/23S rRNA pseudouridine746 synthase